MSDSFDNLLARTEHRDTRPAGSCPEAGVLAAYLDATLTAPERASVEAHAADCTRCALQLATLVRLEDISGHPQHAPASRWWPRLAWMVPAATAVVVGAIYVGIRTPGVPVAPPAPKSATFQDRAELKETDAVPQAPEKGSLDARRYAFPSASTAAPVPESTSLPSRMPAPRTEAYARASPPTPTDVASTGKAAANDLRITGDLLRKPEEQQAAPAAAAPVHQRSADEPESLARAAKRADVSLPLVVRSPDARVQWRVLDARIERSTDAGRTWIVERAPVADAITMAAAVSTEVCWMAAAAGIVLRRTEGGTWVDVSPVPRLSIVRLDVATSLEASLVSSDGKVVKTADGGRTWMR